jgi:hypothetical protein
MIGNNVDTLLKVFFGPLMPKGIGCRLTESRSHREGCDMS